MTAGEALYAICVADTGVRALIGDGASPPNIRLYPAGNIPQSNGAASEILPAATYQTIGGAPANVFELRAPADNERIQIDCWATSYDSSVAIAEAIRTALENQDAQTTLGIGACTVSFNGRDYESETKRYRSSFDISVWISRDSTPSSGWVQADDISGQFLRKLAGVNLAANIAVVVRNDTVYPVDPSAPDDAGEVVGVTVQSATVGSTAIVQTYGVMTKTGWTWAPGSLFYTAGGVLTQTLPAGETAEVARAINATQILINIKSPG